MNGNTYDKIDSINAFKGMVCLCLSFTSLFLLPMLLLNMGMDVEHTGSYYKMMVVLSIIFLIPVIYYRPAMIRAAKPLRKKKARLIFKRDILLLLVPLGGAALSLYFFWTLFLMTIHEGWVFVGYPVFLKENQTIFFLGVFGWLCLFCLHVIWLVRAGAILLRSVRDWRKLS